MEKALEILYHIEELYTENPDREKLNRLAEQNPERVQAWTDAFAEYDLSDVLMAIDDFWQYKSSKSKPSVAQIKAVLTTKQVETAENSKQGLRNRILKCADEHGDKWGKEARERYIRLAQATYPEVDLSRHDWKEPTVLGVDRMQGETDIASKFMQMDLKNGDCRHLLSIYYRMVAHVAEEVLSHEMPASIWEKLSFKERVEEAFKRGLFADYKEYLVEICRQTRGKDYQFESENILKWHNVPREEINTQWWHN